MLLNNEYFMRQALMEAKKAFDKSEIPIGAVIVNHDRIIARAHNLTEMLNDVTAHAEILAITAASVGLGSKYLNECKLYVTLEPCVMCAGAAFWAQLGEIHFGARDDRRGFTRIQEPLLHPKTKLSQGLFAMESKSLLDAFFRNLR